MYKRQIINTTFIKLEINFDILFSKLVIVMEMDQLVLHVMIMVYATVKPISSMTNVMRVKLGFFISLHVKVNNNMPEKLSRK